MRMRARAHTYTYAYTDLFKEIGLCDCRDGKSTICRADSQSRNSWAGAGAVVLGQNSFFFGEISVLLIRPSSWIVATPMVEDHLLYLKSTDYPC